MLFRKTYISQRISFTKIWIIDWDSWEWYEAGFKKPSLKTLPGMWVRDSGAAKAMEIPKRQNDPTS